jgi:hypothetical protein
VTQIPWRRSVKHHPGEAIGSLVIRLAPEGLLTPGEFLKYHFNRDGRLPSTDIATDPEALKDLALIGGFDVEQLYRATWKTIGAITEFLGRRLPRGWFKPELRRLAPGVLRADGDDPWIRNEWQIRALPCDFGTGEIVIERCVNCGEQLAWARIQSVCSCGICGYDQRKAKSRYAPKDILSGAREIGSFLRGDARNIPGELAALEDQDFLALIAWLAYFVALPDCVLVMPSPLDAATGFRLAMQWPHSFDDTLDDFLSSTIGCTHLDETARIKIFEAAIVAVGRVHSRPAETLIKERLLFRLRLSDHFDERFLGFIEPVAGFASSDPGAASAMVHPFNWPVPSKMEAMRSSHDRTRRRPPSSGV